LSPGRDCCGVGLSQGWDCCWLGLSLGGFVVWLGLSLGGLSLVGIVFVRVFRLVGFVLGRVVVWLGLLGEGCRLGELSWGGGVWGMFFDDFIFNLI